MGGCDNSAGLQLKDEDFPPLGSYGQLREAYPLFDTLNRRGLNPTKNTSLAHIGRLNSTAAPLANCISISAVLVTELCYAELPFSSTAVAVTVASTHCAYPRGMTRLSWLGWLIRQPDVLPVRRLSPVPFLTRINA